jgi:hypothetical protein
MNPRARLWLMSVLTFLLLGGAVVYGVSAYVQYQARASAPSQVKTAHGAVASGPRIVFRNTAAGAGYGLVASVPLSNPKAARTVTSQPCDRVYATAKYEMCLHTDSGVVTTFNATLFNSAGKVVKTWPLPGVPSRTRISSDSSLVAQTSFVTGSSYGTIGFSTQTTISATKGLDYGNLENFTFIINGQQVLAADRNFWGVTFASDDNTFYVTGATAGKTYLVRGDLKARTLTAIKETAECPSLSPDGLNVAFKKNVSTTATPYWKIAVLNFASGNETILPIPESVDDQVLWLNNSTLLYGLPSSTVVGDDNIWSIPISGSGAPKLFLAHAWSPSVVP